MTLKYNPRTGEWEGTTGGVNVVELDRRTPKPIYQIQKTKEQKQAEIRSEVMADPNYSYAIRLTEYISAQLELKMGRSVFRNRRASCYHTPTKQIYFGYECVDNIVSNGFSEYPEVGHVWVQNGYKGEKKRFQTGSKINMKNGHVSISSTFVSGWKFEGGKKGIWMLVLHEMAHAVQHTKNGFWFKSIHNDIFIRELEELIILFPYEEVKEI